MKEKRPFSAIRDEAANASCNRQQPGGREHGDSKAKAIKKPHEGECKWDECNGTIGCKDCAQTKINCT